MSPQPLRLGVLFAASAALLSACAVGPNYKRPPLSGSEGYGPAAAPPTAAEQHPELVSGQDIPAEWWGVFHSQDLDALVAEALRKNPTIEAARATLRSAREQVRAQRGAYFPSVSASLQPSRQRVAPVLASPLQSNEDLYNLTTTQVSVAYTPDLFGANRRAVESLAAQADQQRFELQAARLTLASNVVQAAVQDAALREQVTAAEAIVADQREILTSLRRQHELGQTSDADVAAQEALLAQTEATLPPLQKAFGVNRDLLAALVGRTPGEALDARFDLRALTLPERLPLSLPAQLVRRRPDVRIAEAELHAASAQVGVATAARWPSIELDAAGGSAALGLTPTFNSVSNFWSLAATLTQPIFQGRALLHRQRAAEAAYEAAAAQYRATVVGAFQNTADVLHALSTDADAFTAAETSETASRRSLEIARRQLALGDISRLAVLNAEQVEAQARLARLQAEAARYADVAALYQALGGGWWNAPADGPAKPAGTAR
ncbi:efflux transporter outer membrane subunit [Phenylobacterium sp.]|uniref:efflux transporter outer membrane subunit n=1 Tax=Phenylobacterium sp. TaxID=1871053 RepID=UPI00120E56C8|nr:efflux transporter outer membrane subunit [Phenylobacterium sp.]THD61294.1 MAG: efflux transporter outer membrane subunit [Phenylobacterium sp.]